jgi:hypothetical protein
MSSEPNPMEPYDVTLNPYDHSHSISSSSGSSSLPIISSPSGSDSSAAEARANKAIAELAEYKRSSVALTARCCVVVVILSHLFCFNLLQFFHWRKWCNTLI